jgi:demethylmenaquinone methyltransferase/2-methoxy-6-polyprenyl-1,4-benzoquinol methylase
MSAESTEKARAERVEEVRGIFSSIPAWYDFLNHFLSMRRDVAWRRLVVSRMRFFRTNRLLDVATGTGDLAIMAARAHPGIEVRGVDLVPRMVERGMKKVRRKGLERRVDLVEGDALDLPFDRDSFDVASIAFGIRNIPDTLGALREMMRVTVPGGKVMVLELTRPSNPLVRAVYGFYLMRVIPFLGRAFSHDPRAYSYLGESIMEFLAPDEFSALMREAGLLEVKAVPLTLGIAHLHTAIVPEE